MSEAHPILCHNQTSLDPKSHANECPRISTPPGPKPTPRHNEHGWMEGREVGVLRDSKILCRRREDGEDEAEF